MAGRERMSQKEEVVRTTFQIELTAHIEASGTIRGACRSVRTILSHWTGSLGAPACRVRSSLRETVHLSVGDTAVSDTGSICPTLCTLGPRPFLSTLWKGLGSYFYISCSFTCLVCVWCDLGSGIWSRACLSLLHYMNGIFFCFVFNENLDNGSLYQQMGTLTFSASQKHNYIRLPAWQSYLSSQFLAAHREGKK